MSLFLALATLSACDSYPRDIDGTHDRIAATRQLRVGFGEMPPDRRALAGRFVDRLAAASAVQPVLRAEKSNEALFAALEHGDLDLVMTEVATDSPWQADVAVIEPLALRRLGDRELGLSAVVRNGENRWVMTLERQARDWQPRP